MKSLPKTLCRSPIPVRGASVRCRKCEGCLRRYSLEFQGRIAAEAHSCGGMLSFVTLTFAPEHLPADVAGCDRALTSFLKRFRIQLKNKFGATNARFAAVLEQGTKGTRRYHWHLVIFGVPKLVVGSEVGACWQLGFVNVRRFSGAHAAYIGKYISKSQAGSVRWSRGLGYAALRSLYCREYGRKGQSSSFLNPWYRFAGRIFRCTDYLRRNIFSLLRSRGVALEYSTPIDRRSPLLLLLGSPTSQLMRC